MPPRRAAGRPEDFSSAPVGACGSLGALEFAQRAVNAAPGRVALQDTLASALAQAGQAAQAIEVQKKVAAAPEVPAYRLHLARLYRQAGDKSAA